jgi:hypothetical protein
VELGLIGAFISAPPTSVESRQDRVFVIGKSFACDCEGDDLVDGHDSLLALITKRLYPEARPVSTAILLPE